MEYNSFCLHFSVFNVNFVSTQHNGDVLTDAHQISMPVRHILIRHTSCHIEHDDGALTLNVVAVSKSTEFLLSRCVPDVESDGPSICVEC